VHGVQASRGQRVQRLLREPPRLIDVCRRRGDLGLGEVTDRLVEQFVLFGRSVGGKIAAHLGST
jgi:hypothetical protein